MPEDGKSGDLFRYKCRHCGRLFISNKKQEAKTRCEEHEKQCK